MTMMRALKIAGWTGGLGMLALALRYRITNFESRYQIVLFILLSTLAEGSLASMHGRRIDTTRLLVGYAASIVAIVTMKWSLEGLPPFLFAIAN